jgi:hypothetical protein
MGSFGKWLTNIIYGTENIVDRVHRLRKVQCVLTTVQGVICLIVLIFGIVSSNQGEKQYRSITAGVVGITSAAIGAAGAILRNEFLTRTYFIIQMWVLSTITVHIYVSLEAKTISTNLCTPKQGSFSGSDTISVCEGRGARDNAKFAFAFLGGIIAIVSAMVALDFNDVLNDWGQLHEDELFNEAEQKRAQERVEEAQRTEAAQRRLGDD